MNGKKKQMIKTMNNIKKKGKNKKLAFQWTKI